VGAARKRIHAIKEYTALGSGFKIAMRDLEIRGAGNLLGTRQSGHIAQIGFDLYCQLLRQSVARLKGTAGDSFASASFKADFLDTRGTPATAAPAGGRRPKPQPAAPVQRLSAFIPTTWLADTSLRVAAFRELAEATTEAAVAALEASWRDRHGRLPEPVVHLLQIARIKALAAGLGIASVEIQGQRLMLHKNGEYILVADRRFPRLQSADNGAKLREAITLLRNF
jgi:transcription-repair coupling factor (superfamily II helicase)